MSCFVRKSIYSFSVSFLDYKDSRFIWIYEIAIVRYKKCFFLNAKTLSCKAAKKN